MQHEHQVRWDSFIASCTKRDLLTEWLEALHHCERWKQAHPELALPEPVMLALQQMVAAYQLLKPMIEDSAHYDEPAPPRMTSMIFGLTMKVRREVPTVEQIGHA